MDGYIDCVTDDNGKIRHYTYVCAHPQMEGKLEDLYEMYDYKFKNHPNCRLLATFSIKSESTGGVCEPVEYDSDLKFTNVLVITENYQENLRRFVKKGLIAKEVYEDIYDTDFEAEK